MVDAVSTNYVFKGTRKVTIKLTNISDGTGESTVTKVDLSTLIGPNGLPPTRTVIESIEANIQGFTSVKLYWDHTTNDEMVVLGSGFNYFNWEDSGGLVDPASSGGTGDIILTTTGASATATYDITLSFRLKD